ncbi:hypothetical protein GQ473_00035, partial [archaeon]|nr:hypothetical protein [archaeon]
MASLIFPNDPVVGQTYMAPGGKVWRWGGEGWICLVDSGSQIYYNATPPDDIAKYPLWVNTDTGDLMVFYQDVDSDQWLKIGTTGGGSGSGGAGGATYIDELLDVDTTGVSVNDRLEWDGTNWVPVTPSATATGIDDLTDVDTTTSAPSANDLLQWVSPNWVPYTLVTTNWDTAYTHSQSAHAPTDADNTATNETSHTDVIIDGDFASNGFMIRTGLGAYSIDTNTYLTSETSHADVLVDGDFTANGIMLRTALGVYSITTDNSTNWDTAYTHAIAAHAPTDADNTATNETSHTDVVVDGDFASNGSMERTALGTYITILHKRDATAAPLITDDSGDGYSIGSRWIDVTNNKEYIALDVTVGAAVWKETTQAGGGGSVEVQDEGSSLTLAVTKFNFVGAGVTVTEPVTDEILVTIPSGGSALEVEDEGTPLTAAATKLNFAGVGVTVTEPVTDEMLITIPGGAGVGELDDLSDVDTTTTAPVTDDILEFDGTNWVPVANAGGGGASSWIDLTDTDPTTFADQKGKSVVVNQTEDGLEFGTQGNIVYQDEVSFRASVTTTTTSLPALTNTIILWDTEEYDNGDNFDTSTNRFTAPVDGRYVFSAQVMIDTPVTSDTRYEISILVNGAGGVTNIDYSSIAGFETMAVSTEIELTANDYVEIKVHNKHATNDEQVYNSVASERYTFWTGHLISPSVTVAPNGIQHAFSVHNSGGTQTDTTNGVWTSVDWTTIKYEKNVSFD